MRMVKEGLKDGNLEVKTNWVSEEDFWNSFEGWCTNPLLFYWVLTYEPKCLHRRWYSEDKTMERRWLDWLGVCGVRNSHFTLRIEIVGAFPTLVWGAVGLTVGNKHFLQQRMQTGNRYFVRNVHCFCMK